MKTYGLIGFPLGHSFSQKYFTEKFAKEGIDSTYSLFALPTIDDVVKMLDENPSLVGFNVTIPYKQQIIKFLDDIDEETQRVGAVNVVKIIEKSGKRLLKGYNSDIYGFENSIRPLLKAHHKNALIFGTGGASKAVSAMLRKLGIEFTFVSRTPAKGQLSYSQLDDKVMERHTVLVNCSPLGMAPHFDTCPDIPYNAITTKHLAYDLVYNPEETLFLKKARERGATTKNGLEMLHLQAERAWEIWNDDSLTI